MDLEYQYLVARLQEALARDQRLGAQDIRVVVTHGRVHLLGEVATETRRLAVDAIVREVAPDVLVRNELRVLAIGDAAAPEAIE